MELSNVTAMAALYICICFSARAINDCPNNVAAFTCSAVGRGATNGAHSSHPQQMGITFYLRGRQHAEIGTSTSIYIIVRSAALMLPSRSAREARALALPVVCVPRS